MTPPQVVDLPPNIAKLLARHDVQIKVLLGGLISLAGGIVTVAMHCFG